jgi:hypothetical protein
MVLGNMKLENIKELLYFKESLSVLLISILFILLAANMNIEDLMLLYDWKTLALFGIVVFIIRPLAVFVSTKGSNLAINERIFISWVGPRGIVAAGIASLFGSKLIAKGVEGAEYITPLVFMIVLGTVLLNATTARLFAKLVGVFLTKSEGVLIVGASRLSRIVGKYLFENGRHVVLIDSNESNINNAKKLGLEAFTSNIYSDNLADNIELNDVGFLLALTGNSEINKYAITKYGAQFGEHGSFRLMSPKEQSGVEMLSEKEIFSPSANFNMLMKIVEEHPAVHEIEIEDHKHYNQLLLDFSESQDRAAFFLKDQKGELHVINPSLEIKATAEDKYNLVYLGKPLAS